MYFPSIDLDIPSQEIYEKVLDDLFDFIDYIAFIYPEKIKDIDEILESIKECYKDDIK